MSALPGFVEGREVLFGRAEMSRLIDPSSIAVVGASDGPGSFGRQTLENIRLGYRGRVFVVNPRHRSVAGMPCHPSLADLPETPDCVVVAVPGGQVLPVVEQAATMGVGGMIVFSSGFAEIGDPEKTRIQRRMAVIAAETGMRIVGPNCVGVVNLNSMAALTFMPRFNEMRQERGGIGLISQSGALGYCVLQGMERGIGFSHYLSTGNSCDVDVCDMINYLVDDESTKVIACMFEGVRDGGRLLRAARRALEADKPLLIYKMAASAISQRTALSHTGTMAGSGQAYAAAFERTGVVQVDDWEALLETAAFFSKAGQPKAAGIGVVASSGGAAVMAADKAEILSVPLPAPQPETAAILKRVIPDFGSVANPCDLTAESLKSLDLYGECIDAFARDPDYAALVVPMMSAHRPATEERARFLARLAETLQKPICIVWINEWLNGPGSEIYDASPRLSMFRSMRRCFGALRAWLAHYQRRDALLRQPLPPRQASDAGAGGSACPMPGRTLSESESKRLLAKAGVPVTRERLAADPRAAALAAREIGFPVALKLDSADIPHKTEAGVVRLGLRDEAGVEAAAGELARIGAALPGKPAINGILVQEMANAGAELMVGMRRDPQFGPLVLCGFGGIDVELVRDVAVSLAPVDREQARAMILSLKKAPILTGYRNRPALDLDALIDVVCKVSALALEMQDSVAEIDINPFILHARGGMAVDALIVVRDQEKA
ncbi:acetate--CoA ligase family protein [Achromobacter aloeverae]